MKKILGGVKISLKGGILNFKFYPPSKLFMPLVNVKVVLIVAIFKTVF